MLENSVTRAVFPMGEITISQWKRHSGFWFNSKTGTGRKWSSYLFVNLSKLFQVVLKKGNFLLLRSTSASIVTVKLNALHREFQSSAKPCRNSRGSSGTLECKFAKGRKAFLSPKLKRSYFTCWYLGAILPSTQKMKYSYWTIHGSWTESQTSGGERISLSLDLGNIFTICGFSILTNKQ